MASSRKNRSYGQAISLIFLLVVVLASAWYFVIIRPMQEVSDINTSSEFKPIDRKILTALKELKVCGNWPIKAVNLSGQRGNPFSRKNTEISNMAAVSLPECLPVSQ